MSDAPKRRLEAAEYRYEVIRNAPDADYTVRESTDADLEVYRAERDCGITP